jgi:hypothetical protein
MPLPPSGPSPGGAAGCTSAAGAAARCTSAAGARRDVRRRLGRRRDVRRRLGRRRDVRRRLTGRDVRGRLKRRVRRVSQPGPDGRIMTPGGTRGLAVIFTRRQCGIRPGRPFPHLVHLLPPCQFAIFSSDTFVKSASQPLLTARSRVSYRLERQKVRLMHVSYPVRAAASPLDTLASADWRRPIGTGAIHETRVNPEVPGSGGGQDPYSAVGGQAAGGCADVRAGGRGDI